jgi:hypothetical protein
MKISEMIEHLNELKNEFGDKELVLSITDHTDYIYHFSHPGFDIGTVYDEDGEFDGNEEYCVCDMSV